MERSNIWSILPLTVSIFLCSSKCQDFKCAPGLNTGGVTVPKGDIKIKYGNPLEIFCLLDPLGSYENYTSDSLVFYHHEEIVPKKFIHIINSTATKLVIDKPLPSASSYYCKIRQNDNDSDSELGICFNKVFVGTSPKEVKNFSCESRNWQELTCTWTPTENYVDTNYTLLLLPTNSLSFLKKEIYSWISCPQHIKNKCFWDSSTTPIYRKPYNYFIFNLTAQNEFGRFEEIIPWDHYANVVPDKPLNLSLVEATFNSLKIQWDIPTEVINLPLGLVHKIEYQSQWEPVWLTVNSSKVEPVRRFFKGSKTLSLNITELKFSHSLYDIRVFVRPNSSEPPYKWSQPATITLRTKQTVPGMSPKTTSGSYQAVKNNNKVDYRDILIYWQQIPKYMENGDDFDYEVISVEEDGQKVDIRPYNITKTYAKFKNLSGKKYSFEIVAKNKEGLSNPPSQIIVPSLSESPPGPVMFTKIAYDEKYGLIWKPPINFSNIHSYTVFWCDNEKDRPYECIGYLNWTSVPKENTSINITMPKENALYQFAISANSEKASSGMQWASCVLPGDKANMNSGHITTAWIENPDKRSFVVKWKVECLDQGGIVKEFVVHYCPIESPEILACKGKIEMKLVKSNPRGDLIEQVTITDLQPYTTYAVNVSIKGSSSVRQTEQVTTLEAAPDMPPSKINVTDITNSSAILTWYPPEPRNGKILDYKVYWANGSVTNIKNSDEETRMVILLGLDSSVNYTISMSACTKECSSKSDPIHFRTKIGVPGIIQPPLVYVVEGAKDKINITWNPPSKPAGPIHHYDILFEQIEGNDRSQVKLQSENIFYEMKTGCSGPGSSTIFTASVRAVNFDSFLNRSYPGPWSNYGRANCIPSSLGLNAIIFLSIIGVIFLILVCLLIGIFIRWVWLRCKAMQNVEIKLPPNLTPGNDKEKDNEYHLAMHVWNPHLQDNTIKDIPCPDQQLLLKKDLDGSVEEGEDCGENKDSSGCGSGHGSVSSSNNGGAQISSDSGTEADQRASSPEVFSDSPNQRYLLHQRAISSSGSGNENEEGYSRVASAGPVAESLGYVAVPASNPSRGYIMHPPLWMTSDNPPKGYVLAAPSSIHNTIAPTTYCQVGWKPAETDKSNRDWVFPGGSAIMNRDQMTDSEGESQLNGATQPSSL